MAARGPAVGALLCAVTMLLATWTLLATGWVDGAGGAAVVAMAAVVEAAVLAYARVPRWLVLVLVPILALAAIVPATISTLPFDGDASVGHLLGRYVGASFGGLASSQDWPFTVGLCAVLWLCGYWTTWMALREHRGVLAVLPLYIVLATNVLNARTGHDPALPTVLTVGFSFLVIANAHLDSLQARWDKRRIRPLRGIRSGLLGSTALAAFGIVVAGSLLPRATSQDISGQFFTGSGADGRAGAGDGAVAGAPGTIAFNGITQPGGPLVSNPEPVLTYTSSTSAPVYLRVIDDTDFSQGNWYPEHGGTTYDHALAFTGLEFAGGTLPRDRSPADGAFSSAVAVVTTQVTLKPDATGDVDQAVFAGDPVSSSAGGIAFGTVDQSRGGDQLLTVDSVQLSAGIDTSGTRITTRAALSTATEAQLRAAGTAYPAFVERYTQLPDDGTHGAAKIASLALQWTRGTANPYDAAVAIEDHLRDPTAFTYTLNPPAPPASEWPVVFFLTDSHRGYCQYFASAMGAMLRSLGIPTRLVNGYGPGSTLSVGNRHGQRVQQVTTSDAHTWVEAYFPGYGWIPFEPTPPSAQGDYVPISRGSAALPAGAAPGAVNVKPGTSNSDQAVPRASPPPRLPVHPGAPAPDPGVVLLGAAGVLGLCLVAGLVWLLIPRTQRGAWRRVEVIGRLLGIGRQPHETHRAYARRFDALIAAAGRRVDREQPTAAVARLAQVTAATEFAPPWSAGVSLRGTRSLWIALLRAAPAMAWRTIARRGAAQPG